MTNDKDRNPVGPSTPRCAATSLLPLPLPLTVQPPPFTPTPPVCLHLRDSLPPSRASETRLWMGVNWKL
jgi:hypothetical protein